MPGLDSKQVFSRLFFWFPFVTLQTWAKTFLREPLVDQYFQEGCVSTFSWPAARMPTMCVQKRGEQASYGSGMRGKGASPSQNKQRGVVKRAIEQDKLPMTDEMGLRSTSK